MKFSNPAPLGRVIFFQIQTNAEKIQRICETVENHFQKKEPIALIVEDERSETFLDELLWKYPPTQFLPHKISNDPCSDWIVISKQKKILNEAKVAFNLCSTPLLIEGVKLLYELEDLSHPGKKRLAELRFERYKQASLLIEAR